MLDSQNFSLTINNYPSTTGLSKDYSGSLSLEGSHSCSQKPGRQVSFYQTLTYLEKLAQHLFTELKEFPKTSQMSSATRLLTSGVLGYGPV